MISTNREIVLQVFPLFHSQNIFVIMLITKSSWYISLLPWDIKKVKPLQVETSNCYAWMIRVGPPGNSVFQTITGKFTVGGCINCIKVNLICLEGGLAGSISIIVMPFRKHVWQNFVYLRKCSSNFFQTRMVNQFNNELIKHGWACLVSCRIKHTDWQTDDSFFFIKSSSVCAKWQLVH